MTLQPSDGVLSVITKVAREDPEAANTLCRLALYESLVDQIDEVRPRLDQDGARWMAERVTKARTVLKSIDGSTDVEADLALIEEAVSKDLIGAALALFNRRHPRDEQGRFVKQPVGGRTPVNSGLNSRAQGHKQEAVDYVNRWKGSKLVNDETEMQLHFTRVDENGRPLQGADGPSEQRQPTRASNVEADIDTFMAANPGHLLSGVSFDRKGIPVGGSQQRAALDAAAMFTRGQGGTRGLETLARGARALPYDGEQARDQSGTATEWNRPSSPGDRQSYRRLQMTGQTLQNISAPGSAAHTVGSMARLIGDLGPEAEKVLGPGVRRTAYRYRGTERRPDRLVVTQVEEAQRYAAALAGPGREMAVDAITRQATARNSAITPSMGVAAHYTDRKFAGWSQDQLELGVRGDTAVITLLDAVPDERLAAISIEAGELPPSQGVIIDADGDIVSQAQGFNGDHYLPFDLRNLGDLHGGQYVRTRAAGGPTTEDIYTGLMTGARQMQVVSNSGVFTVEFDPDLRGGRRYTDKASRMIGRYGKLLEAIEGGGLYETDVEASERAQLRIKAYEQMGWDPAAGEDRYRQLLDRARLQGSVNQEDEAELFERAVAEVTEAEDSRRQAGRSTFSRQQRAKAIEDSLHEMKATENAARVRRMVLDGKGYAAALKSLKQEFPFFIRDVRFETVRDFAADRKAQVPETMRANPHARDRGYVDRGQTNARSTLSEGDHRLVPTGRAQRGQAEAPAPGLVPTGGAKAPLGSAAAAAAPAKKPAVINDGKVVVAIAEGTKPLTDLVGPGSQVQSQVADALARTAGIMTHWFDANPQTPDPAPDATIESMSSAPPLPFAHFVASVQFRRDPRGLADWLYNKASDVQRTDFLEGLHKARANADRWEENGVAVGDELLGELAGSPKDFDAALDKLDATLSLKAPFAEPAQDMVLADPIDGKPQPFPAILALGDKVANYDAFRAEARDADQQLAGAIQMAESNPREVTNSIKEVRGQLVKLMASEHPDAEQAADLRTMLEALQRGWSYVVARRIAEGVDDGPKEEAAKRLRVVKRHQSRRVVWHSPSEPFSKAVQEALRR